MMKNKQQTEVDALELLSTINPNGSVSVYVQLENLIHFGLASGAFRPKDRLPSARDLADRLGINMNTVAKAYRDLVVMGLLNTKRGLGVFVNDAAPEKSRQVARSIVNQHLYEAVSGAKRAGYKPDEIISLVEKIMEADGAPYASAPGFMAD